ncbi:hypothetical protein ACX6XY_21980 [Streptomyces sp. O3]
MSMQRTNVYADADDLALIKEASVRLGRSESEIIRYGVHLAALSVRTWDTPAFTEDELIPMGGPVSHDEIKATRREAAERTGKERSR